MANPREPQAQRRSPVEVLGEAFSRRVERWMPDPLIFALLLLFLTFVLAMVVQRKDPYTLAQYTYKGFWALLTFGMQVVLQVVLGYALASHPLIHRLLVRVTRWPRSGGQAAALIAFVTMLVTYVFWSVGVIVGAFLAREMARQAHFRNMKVHYPVLAVAAYTGLGLNWHWGLSGTAPLMANTPGYIFEKITGLIPMSQTVLHPYTIWNTVIIFAFGVAAMYLFHPAPARSRGIEDYVPEALGEERTAGSQSGRDETPADRMENSRALAFVTSAVLTVGLVWWFLAKGLIRGLDLNSWNFLFLVLGFWLYLNPIRYYRAIREAAGATAGIILQFPFYAAIMGIMTESGLAATIAGWLAQLASPATLPVVTLVIAGLVNLFIPSGGGEWAAIGESISRAALALQVPPGKALIAYAAGDAWTNLFQPFWAIPLLAVTGLQARNIFGYCILLMIFAFIPFALGLTFIPY